MAVDREKGGFDSGSGRSTSPVEVEHSKRAARESGADEQDSGMQHSMEHGEEREAAFSDHRQARDLSTSHPLLPVLQDAPAADGDEEARYTSRKPFRIHPQGPHAGLWLKEEERATELLSLFFDLVVVALLTVFSNTHKIQSAGAIPVFLSYYVVIVWVWSSQVHYDIRYEAEDTFHRLAKCVQIIVLVYMGASSGGWSPGIIIRPEYLPNLSERDQAAESFLTVLIAYAVYRAILFVQYSAIIFDGRRSGNEVRGAIISALTIAASCVIGVIATAIPATDNVRADAKVALFYISIAIEIAGAWYQLATGTMGEAYPGAMAERFAAQSLIILGEGFSNLTTAFSYAISGLSVNTFASYAQIFLVVIMYNLWSLLFSHFRKVRRFRSGREILWEFIHFPLHFSILLLVAAIVNVILVGTFSEAMGEAADKYDAVLLSLVNQDPLPPRTLNKTSIYLNRLGLDPSFNDEYSLLLWSFNETLNNSNSTDDIWLDAPTLALQYYGQLISAVARKSGVQINNGPVDQLANLSSITPFGGAFSNETFYENLDQVYDAVYWILEDAYRGTYWLYPTAGGVLVFCALRSMIRFENPGLSQYLAHGLSCVMGLGLACLGFTAIGGSRARFDADGYIVGGNRMVYLVESDWSLAIVVFVYTFVTTAHNYIPVLVTRWRGEAGRRAQSPEDGIRMSNFDPPPHPVHRPSNDSRRC